MKKIFIICTVRNATQQYLDKLYAYVENLETEGHEVHLPPRDTKQEDETGGYVICRTNMAGMMWADEVHVSYNEKSTGTHFDLGMAFMAHKKIHVFDGPEIDESVPKSFPKMMRHWENVCDTCWDGYSYVAHNFDKCPKCGEIFNEKNI